MPYPDPFGGELPLDAVKANPRRGSSTNKKDAFQNLLNSATGQLVAQVPSQMPGAMGGGFDHGIAGNMSDIQSRPIGYGLGGSTPALDADGRPIPGTSTGVYQRRTPGVYQMGTPYYTDPSSNALFQILTPRRN